MRLAYVVMETAWEYNDEQYSTGDGDPGFPRRIFLSRISADLYREEREREAWRARLLDQNADEDLSDYVSCDGDILEHSALSEEAFVSQLAAAGLGYDLESNEFTFPDRNFQDWEIDQIRGVLSGLTFYSVEPLELED